GGVGRGRRLGRDVVEEEGELTDGDLVAALDRRQAREPPSVEERAVARVEVPNEPLPVQEADLSVVARHSDVVDDDVQSHFTADSYDRPVEVVNLLRGSLDHQSQLWHLPLLVTGSR